MRSEKNLPLGDALEDDELKRRSGARRGSQEPDSPRRTRRSGKRSTKSPKGGYANRLTDMNYVRQIGTKAPQAVAVVCSYANGSGVKRLLNYVGRIGKDKEIELEDDMGCSYRGREGLNELYDYWKQFFDEGKSYWNKQGRVSRSRHAAHIILSASCELTDHNVNLVAQATRDTAREVFAANGYDYAIGLHQDSKHPHAHLIVRCNPSARRSYNKLRLNPKDLLNLRRVFAEHLSEWGLEHKATLRADEPKCVHDFITGKSQRLKTKKDNWYRYALKSVREQVELLEKRDEQFREANKKAQSAKAKYEHLKSVRKAIDVLREGVRQETQPKTKQRYDSMSLLRSFERRVDKRHWDKDKVQKTFLGLLKGLNPSLDIYDPAASGEEKVKAVKAFLAGKQPRKKKSKSDEVAKILASIAEAKKDVRKRTDMSRPEKKELRKKLKEFERSIQAGLKSMRGREA